MFYLATSFCFLSCCILIIFGFFYNFGPQTSLILGLDRSKILHDSIYTDPQHKMLNIVSMNTNFNVAYVKNTKFTNINPHFPTIHIKALGSITPTAWLQIIRTDSSKPQYKEFIDTWPDGYPFYSYSAEMYDCPAWGYTLFFKPITYWKAHAYAIHIDMQKKQIKCLGGIFWGYKLSYFSLWPIMYEPQALTIQDWSIDVPIFQSALPEYSFMVL